MLALALALFAPVANAQSIIARLSFDSWSLCTSVSIDGGPSLSLALDLQSAASWVSSASVTQIRTQGLGAPLRAGSALQQPGAANTSTAASPSHTHGLFPGSRFHPNSTALRCNTTQTNQTLPGATSAFSTTNPIDNSTVSGTQKISLVEFAGVQVDALVGVVLNAPIAISASLQQAPSTAQPGVVGLGGTSSFLQALVSSGKIDSAAYSIYVNPANPHAGSQLIFGSNTETTLYSGSLCSLAFTDMSTMEFPISAVSLAGNSGTSQTPLSTSAVQAVLSTTTSDILLPESLLSGLVSSVTTDSPSPSSSPSPSNILSALKSPSFCGGLPHQLVLSIGGVVIEVPLTSTVNGTCTVIVGLSTTNYITLGFPFFQQAYTFVNVAQGTIGVAPSIASSLLVDTSATPTVTDLTVAGTTPTPNTNANPFFTTTVFQVLTQGINVYVTIDSSATIIVPCWNSLLQATTTSNIIAATPGVYTIGAIVYPLVRTSTSKIIVAVATALPLNNAALPAGSSSSSNLPRTATSVAPVVYVVPTHVLVVNSGTTITKSLAPPTSSPNAQGANAIQSANSISITANSSINAISGIQQSSGVPSAAVAAASVSASPSQVASPTSGSDPAFAVASASASLNATVSPVGTALFRGNATGFGVGTFTFILSLLLASLCIL